MTCNKCRAYNERKDAEFCGKCGAKLEPPRYAKTAWIKWVGIGIGALFVWGFFISPLLASLFGGQQQPDSSASAKNGTNAAQTAIIRRAVTPTRRPVQQTQQVQPTSTQPSEPQGYAQPTEPYSAPQPTVYSQPTEPYTSPQPQTYYAPSYAAPQAQPQQYQPQPYQPTYPSSTY